MDRLHGGAHKLYIGVDVVAATATAAWMAHDGRMSAPLTVAQTAQGYTTLHERLAAMNVAPTDILASLSAVQHNPAIKPFYDRLRAAGKLSKVACCATARKLLHIAWAVGPESVPGYQCPF